MKLLYIILAIGLIYLFWVVWVYLNVKTPSPSGQILDINSLKTGDLIFISGQTHGEKMIKWITGSEWSHVALIIKEDDDLSGSKMLFVWEADIGRGYKDGPRIVKLSDKLHLIKTLPQYKTDQVIGVRRISRHLNPEKVMKSVKKYLYKKMDYNMSKWAVSNTPLYYIFSDNNKIFCSEAVALVLQDVGVLNKEERAASYSPESFITIDGYSPIEYYSI
jgi:hypothetical protein